MIIYQTYCGEDMAGSDSFHETLTVARKHLREAYGITGPIELDADGRWEGEVDGDGFDVHLERHDIKLTRRGLCAALDVLPNR